MADEVADRVEQLAHRLQARAAGSTKVMIASLTEAFATLRVLHSSGRSDDLVVSLEGGTEVGWLMASVEVEFDAMIVRLESIRPGPCRHQGKVLELPVGGFVQCSGCRLLGVRVGGSVRWAG